VYGTTVQGVLPVPITEFVPPSTAVTWATSATVSSGIQRFQTSSVAVDWWSGFHLPGGAMIDSIALEGCDFSSTGQLAFVLAAGAAPAGTASNVSTIGGTGTTETPGCGFFSVSPVAPLTVDNANSTYWLAVDWQGDFSPNLLVTGFRVYYHLQVSPAPASATFPDVPASDFGFQYIEALNASGITGGCGGGNYCPDSPVTRRQMAIFIAKALGLSFP
jgi:hypothetical protein